MPELKRPIVKPFEKDKFELVENYEVSLQDKDLNLSLIIPKGYKTNGADVPRIFWSLFPPYRSEYFSAVLIHDFLCEKSKTKQDYLNADIAFKIALQNLELNKFKIFIFYHSVKIYHTLKFIFKE